MNLADLCPEGREKYAEFEKYDWMNGLHSISTSPNVLNAIRMKNNAYRKFLEHKRTCEFCKEER